jgi:hypothetical protein
MTWKRNGEVYNIKRTNECIRTRRKQKREKGRDKMK